MRPRPGCQCQHPPTGHGAHAARPQPAWCLLALFPYQSLSQSRGQSRECGPWPRFRRLRRCGREGTSNRSSITPQRSERDWETRHSPASALRPPPPSPLFPQGRTVKRPGARPKWGTPLANAPITCSREVESPLGDRCIAPDGVTPEATRDAAPAFDGISFAKLSDAVFLAGVTCTAQWQHCRARRP